MAAEFKSISRVVVLYFSKNDRSVCEGMEVFIDVCLFVLFSISS